jgi:hypothetical protein
VPSLRGDTSCGSIRAAASAFSRADDHLFVDFPRSSTRCSHAQPHFGPALAQQAVHSRRMRPRLNAIRLAASPEQLLHGFQSRPPAALFQQHFPCFIQHGIPTGSFARVRTDKATQVVAGNHHRWLSSAINPWKAHLDNLIPSTIPHEMKELKFASLEQHLHTSCVRGVSHLSAAVRRGALNG